MSFSLEVKKELAATPFTDKQKISCLSALLRSSAEVVIVNKKMQIEYTTNSAFLARLIVKYTKDLYKTPSTVQRVTIGNLPKRGYLVILETTYKILSELDIIDGLSKKEHVSKYLTRDAESIKGYLRGLFLGCGSVNDPSTSKYHLELKLDDYEYAKSVRDLINIFRFNAKVSQNKGKYIVYLKKAESISDFLKAIGVSKAVLYYEDIRISRDMYNNTNRLVNCDVANGKKTLKYANNQLKMINFLQNNVGLENIPEDLIDVCVLRLENKEASLSDLVLKSEACLGYTLTKSGLNHRFRKLKKYYESIREAKGIEDV